MGPAGSDSPTVVLHVRATLASTLLPQLRPSRAHLPSRAPPLRTLRAQAELPAPGRDSEQEGEPPEQGACLVAANTPIPAGPPASPALTEPAGAL